MLDFLGATGNQPFLVALFIMLGIAIVEGVATLLFGGVSQVIDSMLPEFDVDMDIDIDVDVDADADIGPATNAGIESPGADAGLLTPVLAWLRIGQVPILVLLVIFLTAISLSGFAIQSVPHALVGAVLPGFLVSIPATAGGILSMRFIGGWIARVMPKEETSAVSRQTFVGRVATITIGTARHDQPAEARLRDEHGRPHYVMVVPDVEDETFSSGTEVLIVAISGPRFRVIEAPNPALTDH